MDGSGPVTEADTTVWGSAEQQLADSLEARMEALVDLMFFVDVGDKAYAAGVLLAAEAPALAALIVQRLDPAATLAAYAQEQEEASQEQDEDAATLLAVGAAEDLVTALWPEAQPPASWWTSPLGVLVARHYGPGGSEGVSVVVAAAMLHVTRGRVYQLLDAGHLDRHQDGVSRASVIGRLSDKDRSERE